MRPKFDLTPRCNDILTAARKIGVGFRHKHITTEHIFISILDNAETITDVFTAVGIDVSQLRKNIIRYLSEDSSRQKVDVGRESDIGYSPRVSRIITLAAIEAKKLGHPAVGVHHLTIAILSGGHLFVNQSIRDFGVDIEELVLQIIAAKDPNSDLDAYALKSQFDDIDEFEGVEMDAATSIPIKTPNKQKRKYLELFGVDITEKAASGKIDPIIGMDETTDSIIEILMRKKKNNPVIIGEPGVGKSAAVEALATRIVLAEVPSKLVQSRIYVIDLAKMIAGCKYRGMFEERMQGLVDDLKKSPDVIAFIDEFHTIVGAGSGSGAMDAANMLKPALAAGEITLIGATTYDEYTSFIEEDKALYRRMQPVWVEEPDKETTLEILNGIKYHFEEFHNVKYQAKALKRIVDLTDRYITDRNFPDKAIDILDQLGAAQRSRFLISDAIDDDLEEKINEMEVKVIEQLGERDLDGAAATKREQQKIIEEYEGRFNKFHKESTDIFTIKESHVNELVAKIIDIPIEKLSTNELAVLKDMEKTVRRMVIGQDEAIRTICNTIKRSRVDVSDPNKPIGSFLFLGPTGVGKTHITKELSRYLFDTTKNVFQMDMSEYMEPHSVSKLIGSPPGYIGYEEEPKLIKHIKTYPHSIILIDEIEKAHHLVQNIFLQILQEGHITDSAGNKHNFKNAIIIMTGNIGANAIQHNHTMGFLGSEYHDTQEKVKAELKKEFRPEFINRIDDIVIFNELSEKDNAKIVTLLLKDFKTRLKTNRGLNLRFTSKVNEYLLKNGFDKAMGARPLKRCIQKSLEIVLADFIIEYELTNKNITIEFDVDEDDSVYCYLIEKS
jgi:ATP-dependent Clp protease ATP-binding subunit ClpC